MHSYYVLSEMESTVGAGSHSVAIVWLVSLYTTVCNLYKYRLRITSVKITCEYVLVICTYRR